MPRHAVCYHPKEYAVRIVVCHLSRYAWVIAAVVWKAVLRFDAVIATGSASAYVYGVGCCDDLYFAQCLDDVAF